MRRLALFAFLTSTACSHDQTAAPPAKSVEVPDETAAEVAAVARERDGARRLGKAITDALFARAYDAVWERFTPTSQQSLPLPEWRKVAASVVEAAPSRGRVLRTGVNAVGVRRAYWEDFEVAGASPRRVMWIFDRQDRVEGVLFQPAPEPHPTPHESYQGKTALRVPWEGLWYVGWGGRTTDRNYHVIARDQRFAYDVLVTKNGRTYRGEGKALEDYFAFGLPVVAPGAGVVVAAEGGLPDQAIGQMDPEHAAGNHVIIDHENGEFSLLAHLQQGSVAVKSGDRVEPGQLLGKCGNSGNTSEPHIHFHLQNTAKPFDGDGLPVRFTAAVVDGEVVHDVEPHGGQLVAPAPR